MGGSERQHSGRVELVLLGGRAGVGKTSVAYEMSALLRAAGVAHCHIEGDVLDAAYPKPQDDPDGSGLTERNLRHLAGEYRQLGYAVHLRQHRERYRTRPRLPCHR